MSSMRLMFLGVWLACLSGCSYIADLSLAAKSRRSAECAWKQEHRFYRESGMPYTIRQHFGCGFVKGYEDVANGSNGTPPLFPPQCYWGSAYQSPAGDEKVRAWFDGYQVGATSALRDGRAGTNELPTSWAPPGRVPHAVQIIPGEVIPPGTSEQPVVEPAPAATLRRQKPEGEVQPLPATPKEDRSAIPQETPKQELLEIPQPAPKTPKKPEPAKTPAKESSEVREPSKLPPPAPVASIWRRAFAPRTEVVAPIRPNELATYQAPAPETFNNDAKAPEQRRSEVVTGQYIGTGFSDNEPARPADANLARPLFDYPVITPRRSMNPASETGAGAPSSREVRRPEAAAPAVELRPLFDPPNLDVLLPRQPITLPSETKPVVVPATRELFPGPDLYR